MMPQMDTYKLIANENIFWEGTLEECQKTLSEIKMMIDAGLSTSVKIEDFTILIVTDKK